MRQKKSNEKREKVFKESHVLVVLEKMQKDLLELKRDMKNIEGSSVSKKEYNFIKKRMEVLERQMEKFKVLLKVKRVE